MVLRHVSGLKEPQHKDDWKMSDATTLLGLPVPNSSHSYWRSELSWLDEFQSSSVLPSSCDILIIGGGLSGVATAYHILKSCANSNIRPPSVVILEARQICSGATGRNGGHCKIQPCSLISLVKKHPISHIEELHAFIRANQYAMKNVIEEEGIDCESEYRRSWDVCLDEGDAADVLNGWSRLKESGMGGLQDIDVTRAEFVKYITSMKNAEAAFSTPTLSLWPYKFVTQLLERCLHLGASVHTNTPVTSLSSSISTGVPSGCKSTITTATTTRGVIRASKLIFATNGYTSAILPQYTSVIIPTKATACHIAIPRGEAAPRLSNTYNIRYASDRVDYMNPRPDGGIVIGGGRWTYQGQRQKWWNVVDDSTVFEEVNGHFDGLMQRHFKGWEESGARTDFLWSGIQGVTADQFPHVGRVPRTENQYILAGYNGGGMGMIYLAAKGVAKMVIEGVEFVETGLPSMFEPRPDRFKRVA